MYAALSQYYKNRLQNRVVRFFMNPGPCTEYLANYNSGIKLGLLQVKDRVNEICGQEASFKSSWMTVDHEMDL